MKILGISGSLKATSANTSILHALQKLKVENTEVEMYDRLHTLPHFNPDLDIDPAPETVLDLRTRLRTADAVIISTPEYAFGVPGALKNALDWTVSSGELVEKPVALISASPLHAGGDKAHQALMITLKDALACDIPEEGKLIIGSIKSKMNAEGDMIDEPTIECLRQLLQSLVTTISNKKSLSDL